MAHASVYAVARSDDTIGYIFSPSVLSLSRRGYPKKIVMKTHRIKRSYEARKRAWSISMLLIST